MTDPYFHALQSGRSEKSRSGRYFDDFHLGQRLCHGSHRTLTDADASLYLALTGARQALPCNSELALRLGYPRPPLDDLLVFNIAFGKTVNDISLNAIANLGYADVQFLQPVFAGDTLRCESVVIEVRPSSKPGRGIVGVRSTCLNQKNAPVLQWTRWVMVRQRQNGVATTKDRNRGAGETTAGAAVTRFAPCPALPQAVLLEAWLPATQSSDLWDDYTPGERLDHPSGMTLEEADHMAATRFYQNNARVHFDALYTGQSGGKRLVYGGHIMSLCQALAYDGLENLLGLRAIHAGRHTRPMLAGDTLYASSTIVSKQVMTGRDDVGELRIRLLGLKNTHPATLPKQLDLADLAAHPSVVLDLDYTALIPRRAAA